MAVAVAAAALNIAFKKRKRNQQNGAANASDKWSNEKDNSDLSSVSRSKSRKGVKTSARDQKGRQPKEPSSKAIKHIGAGSALPPYLSGVDISAELNSATPSTDDEESAEGAGKQVSWRDGKKHTKGEAPKEPPSLVEQVTWESLTSWITK